MKYLAASLVVGREAYQLISINADYTLGWRWLGHLICLMTTSLALLW